MDVMTIKMDAQYKEFQSRSKQPNPDHSDDDTPMSHEEEAKFMPTFRPKFDRLADKQSGQPSGSLPSNTQPNPKCSSSKPYQLPQAQNEHVNAVFTRSELVSNKHKLEQISAAFLSDESSALIQNKVPPKLRDLRSFLIPCNFNKDFSCDALADLGASINLMPYSLYAKLSLKTLKPTKISVRLADGSFQYHVGIAKNMLVEVGKLTFPVDFVILEMEEDKDFNALIDEGSKILYSIEGTILEEKLFAEFDEFMAMTAEENSESESDT
ncbi:reverse transcriptase domain-containing protein [Tanacetum coccineum]